MHDPRLGRFFAIDPLASKYSYNSPYSFSENCVIDCIELEGLEKIRHHVYSEEKKKWVVAWVETDKNLKENVNAYHKFNYKVQNYQTVVKPIKKTPGKAESVTYNGNIKPGSDNRENMYMQFKSTAEAKMSQSEKNQAAAVNNSISNDPTNYMSMEGGANGADGQIKQTEKDKTVGGAMVALIATPFTLGGSLTYFETAVVVSSTASNLDDLGTNHKGESTLQQMYPNQQNAIGNFKFVVSTISVGSGYKSLMRTNSKNADLFIPSLISTGIDANSVRKTVTSEPSTNYSIPAPKFDLQTKDNTNIVLPTIRL